MESSHPTKMRCEGPGIDSLPYEIIDEILSYLDYTSLFHVFRFSKVVSDMWAGYSEQKRSKMLTMARNIEDEQRYETLNWTDQILVQRLARAASQCAPRPEWGIKVPSYEEIFPAAVHAVMMNVLYRYKPTLQNNHEEKCVDELKLMWHLPTLRQHWNTVSTIRLFDLFDQLGYLDYCIRSLGHQSDCICFEVNVDYPYHFDSPGQDIDSEYRCISESELLTLELCIFGNVDNYIQAFEAGSNFVGELSYADCMFYATYHRFINPLKKKMARIFGLEAPVFPDNVHAGIRFVHEAIVNRVLTPYMVAQGVPSGNDPDWSLLSKVLEKDVKRLVGSYRAISCDSGWDWSVINHYMNRSKW